MPLTIAQGSLIFCFSLAFVISIFCLAGCYFRRKRTPNSDLEEDELLNKQNQMAQFEMMPIRNISTKLTLNKMVETNNPTARQILNSLDSKRSTGTRVSTPKHSNPNYPQITDTMPFIPLMKHSYSSKLLKYTKQGIQLLDKILLTVRNTKTFKDFDWQFDVVEQGKINKHFYPTNSPNFFDTLEEFGIQQGKYCFAKELTHLDLTNCQPEREYPVQDLSKNKAIEIVTEEEYVRAVQAASSI